MKLLGWLFPYWHKLRRIEFKLNCLETKIMTILEDTTALKDNAVEVNTKMALVVEKLAAMKLLIEQLQAGGSQELLAQLQALVTDASAAVQGTEDKIDASLAEPQPPTP